MEAESETTTTVSASETKPSIGKPGVHLHYHKHHEYKKLTREQLRELGGNRTTLTHTNCHLPRNLVEPTKQMIQAAAAKMQKLNQSINMDTENTAPSSKSAQNDE